MSEVERLLGQMEPRGVRRWLYPWRYQYWHWRGQVLAAVRRYGERERAEGALEVLDTQQARAMAKPLLLCKGRGEGAMNEERAEKILASLEAVAALLPPGGGVEFTAVERGEEWLRGWYDQHEHIALGKGLAPGHFLEGLGLRLDEGQPRWYSSWGAEFESGRDEFGLTREAAKECLVRALEEGSHE